MRLLKVTIHKYKGFNEDQSFDIENDITTLVGVNESGKTSILEAIAKFNYFDESDKDFNFSLTHDYPRKWKKAVSKKGENPKAITCVFELDEEEISYIKSEFGQDSLEGNDLILYKSYDNKRSWSHHPIKGEKVLKVILENKGVYSKTLFDKLNSVKKTPDLDKIISEYADDKIKSALGEIKLFFENKWDWGTPVEEYICRTYLSKQLPKMLYYDEFYSLPSRICIEHLRDATLEGADQKTAKALFELADINIDEIIASSDFEDFKAELEATEAAITEEMFKYWKTNTNLDIEFDIDKEETTDVHGNTRIVNHILDIRVKNKQARVSLPLKNRSKGFNWFFSFLVWFEKIQEDKDSNYILLLDEPGLNLHASAQEDLLRFIEDLSKDYQILFTTHSPFMVESEKLQKIRTVIETESGSKISDSVDEKDSKTLFPLQAAFGYSIAQNLFISKKNLLVEGVSDLIYLQIFSDFLNSQKSVSLDNEVTIVPVGGLDKVSTFISLLRGNKLDLVTLIDSFDDQKSEARVEALVKEKLINSKNILTFDKFVDQEKADFEDIFTIDEYLHMFNHSFSEHDNISQDDLDTDEIRITKRIANKLGVARYNHYRPAKWLLINPEYLNSISKDTIERIEKIITTVNRRFLK